MSQSLSGDQTMQGYEESPKITQFSVFLDNRCGRLLDLLESFDGHRLRLVALSVIDATDHAVVRMVATNPELARESFTERGFAFTETEVLVVELRPDHGLSTICTALLAAEINIHFAYPLLLRHFGKAAIALHTDDMVLAGDILRRKQFNLLGEADLRNPDDDTPRGDTNPFRQPPN